MTLPRRRNRRPDEAAQWLAPLITDPATVPFSVTSDPGVMPARATAPAAFPLPDGPARHHDVALFGRSPLGWALICGVCRTTRHATREANHQRHAFDALRDSATAAGWTLDAFWRWACPGCQQTPRYWPLRTAVHAAPHVRQAKLAGEHVTATAEFWLEVTAEQASFEQVRGARARTAAIIRPDGRFITARIITGNPADPDYHGRHREAAS